MSKGLEALSTLYDYLRDEYDCRGMEETDECKQAIEKELKALEIIKEKRVNVLLLRYSFILEEISKDGIEYYNNHFGNEDFHLTKEEYDLLKEVLE